MPKRIYELKGLAGRGGTSSIYFAAEKKTKRVYIFKTPDCFWNLQHIQKEAEIQRKIRNGKVPKVYGCMQIEGKQGMLMEYKSGRTLEECLKNGIRFPEAKVLLMGMDLCILLIYMHTRNPPVYYLDMKPSNILINRGRLKALVDFGCAQEADSDGNIYADGNGTHRYAAPEQFRTGARLGPETDLYGLAKVLLEMAGDDRLSPETVALLRSCIRTRMKERPSSAGELLRSIIQRYLKLECVQRDVKRQIQRGIGCLLVLATLGTGMCQMQIQWKREQGSILLAAGRELWHADQGREGKLEACRLFGRALEYDFLKQEEFEEAQCYAGLVFYYEGSSDVKMTDTLARFRNLVEMLKELGRPQKEVLEAVEELLQILYVSEEIPDAVYKEVTEETRIYLENIRKKRPEGQQAEVLLRLLQAVEQIKKGHRKDE